MFNRKNNKNKSRGFLYLILAFILYWFLRVFIQKEHEYLQGIKSNLNNFLKDEKEEAGELRKGKESFRGYFTNSYSIFRDYFIPHKHNNHKPKILRRRSLAVIVVLIVIMKAGLTGYLFLAYPYEARMTEIITKRVLELINIERAENGLGLLKSSLILNISAREKAEDMINKDYFAHHSPDGKKPWDWIDRGQYKYLYVGENLAMNFTSADSAHRALMKSPSHKKNILNDRYVDIGLAMVTGAMNGKKTNVLVQLFATTKPVETRLAKAEPAKIKPAEEPDTGAVAVLANEEEKNKTEPVEPVKKEAIKPQPKIEPGPVVVERKPVEAITPKPTVEEKEITEPEPVPIEEKNKDIAILAQTSPNEALEKIIQKEPMVFANIADEKMIFTARVAKTVNYIFIGLLAIMIAALIINIVIRIEVQHKHVIIQTMLVILFITSLIYFKFHVLESGLPNILIL